MIDNESAMRIIDHQDARIGSASYDLVSLLLDRVLDLPIDESIAEKQALFLQERRKRHLEDISADDFPQEFDLQTIQRCLKAIGTFSDQSVNRGKAYFVPYIQPAFGLVLRAARRLERFPTLQRVVEEELG